MGLEGIGDIFLYDVYMYDVYGGDSRYRTDFRDSCVNLAE